MIEKHQQILDIVKRRKVSIINLDQHHDIFYDYFDKMAVFTRKQKKHLESSWVYYLYIKNQLKDYKWVTNSNASFENEHLKFPFCFYIENKELCHDIFGIEPIIESHIVNKKFDKIVFVESPYYLPKTKQVLDLLEEIKTLI